MKGSQNISIETLGNGLTLIIEEIEDVESLAYELLIPGGILTDEPACLGSALLLAELTSRGAGDLDSKALSEAFDRRGIRHSEYAGQDRFVYHGTLLSEHLDEALKLVSLMVREPKLPTEEIEPIQSLLLQDINALMDNPARRAMVELAQIYYPEPYGRCVYGTASGIKACQARSLRLDWERRYGAQGCILSIAGKAQAKEVSKAVARHFGAWGGEAQELPRFDALPAHAYRHIQFESAQLQICLAYPSAPFGHPQYYPAKVANGILSGGMFGRLFIEVREKRGLVYHVSARHSATQDYGTVMVYAGTTPQRARETCQVLVHELRSLGGSIKPEELARAKANLKASLVIGEESPAARAGSNAQDWWLESRVRTLEEIISELERVQAADVDRHLSDFRADSFMSLTLGSQDLSDVQELHP